MKNAFERWIWLVSPSDLEILHRARMENPNSYTSVIILLLNQSRLKNLTQFDGAYVAEFLWLTIMNYILLKLIDFNFLCRRNIGRTLSFVPWLALPFRFVDSFRLEAVFARYASFESMREMLNSKESWFRSSKTKVLMPEAHAFLQEAPFR